MAGDPNDDVWASTEALEPGERLAHNVTSIVCVPWDVLPDGPARFCLLEMAYVGGDVGAYRTADGRWWVHVGGHAETCAAWAARFSQCDIVR